MKVAVISDIHANLAALEAVLEHVNRWQPDIVVVAGDVINRGPEPVACLRLIRDRVQAGWQVLIGNHEEYVLFHDSPDAPREGPRFELFRYSYWTYTRLLAEERAYVRTWPFHVTHASPDGRVLYVTHASPLGTRDGIYPETPEVELRKKIPPGVSVLAVGHTHRPLIRNVDGCLVINAGAVGLPFDGNPHARYAQITYSRRGWQARVVEVPYDRARSVQAFFTTGYVENGGPLTWLILAELRFARSLLYPWTSRYEHAVLQGEITLEKAVREFLDEQGWPIQDILRPRL